MLENPYLLPNVLISYELHGTKEEEKSLLEWISEFLIVYEENDKRQSYVTDQRGTRESVRNVVVDINMHTMMFSIT